MNAMTRTPRAPIALLCIVALLLLAGCGDSDDSGSSGDSGTKTAATSGGPELGPAFGDMTSLPGALKTPPPWPRNEGTLQLRLRAIGLDALTAEGNVVHTHQHLEIFVDGQPVEIPATSASGRRARSSPTCTFTPPIHPGSSMSSRRPRRSSPSASSSPCGAFR